MTPGAQHAQSRTASQWPQPLAPTPVRVLERNQETDDVFTLRLEAPVANRPFRFAPGQFNMLYVFGVGEAALSLSGGPEDMEGVTHTIRAVGSVTNALARCPVGGMVGLRGPYGTPWPLDSLVGQDVLLVSGGMGIAPLRSIALRLLAQRERHGRLIWLHGSRTPRDLVFATQIDEWRRRPDLEMQVSVDRGDAVWRGPVGVVTALLNSARIDPGRTVALVCGPETMMRFVQRDLARLGLPEERTYLSLERNMQCAVGICGHCQLGASFVCMNGPVYRYDAIKPFLNVPEA